MFDVSGYSVSLGRIFWIPIRVHWTLLVLLAARLLYYVFHQNAYLVAIVLVLGVAFTARQVRRLLANPNALTRVACEGTATVTGWCVGLIRRAGRSVTGRIYTLAIDPSTQGRGLGRLLVTNMLDELAVRDVRRVYLEVRADNSRAIALYEKLGFTIVRDLRDYYGDGQHGVSMRRA